MCPEHPYLPISGRDLPRFAGIRTFFRLPQGNLDDPFDLGLIGVPFDSAVSYRPGARFGPAKVRDLSSLGRVYHMERGLSFTKNLRVADVGDFSINPLNREKTYEVIKKGVKSYYENGKRLLSVGGDHSITFPILQALRDYYKEPLALIHFDAHLDTYPAAWGEVYHHGAFLRHAIEEGCVNPKKTVQVGIRGPLATGDDTDFVRNHGITVNTVEDIHTNGLKAFTKQISELNFGKTPTYISYDIDCLDPAFAPGTGTPVPGGLTTYEAQKILRSLNIKNFVGGDVVEVNPAYDHADITALAAVDAIFEMMSLMAMVHSK